MMGNGKGLFGSNPMAMQPDPMQAMTKPREGPSRTQGIAGVLGDMLASLGGGQANYMQNLMQQRQMEQMQGYRTQAAKVAQDADQQQWLARQAYERANPAPRDPYNWRANNGDLMELGADGQARTAYSDPTPRINWVQVRDAATGALTLMPMGPNGPMGGGSEGSEAPDTLPAGFDFGDSGSPQQGMSATAIPPPPSSAAPTAISRQEYNALVGESGQTAVDAYLARRGIQVGNN